MLRFANLDERKKYYKEEFDPMKVKDVLGDWNQFAIIIGKRTKIYLPQYEDVYYKTIKIDCSLENLRDVLLRYLPEAVYYVRRENEILLDFDPNYIKCSSCITWNRWDFCVHQFEKLKDHVMKVYEILEKEGYNPQIHFSGRGFHVIFFADAVIETKNRMMELHRKYSLAFDPIIMFRRLVRLPYSLNSLTTRICIPISADDLETFSLDDDKVIPKFLRCKR